MNNKDSYAVIVTPSKEVVLALESQLDTCCNIAVNSTVFVPAKYTGGFRLSILRRDGSLTHVIRSELCDVLSLFQEEIKDISFAVLKGVIIGTGLNRLEELVEYDGEPLENF